MDIKIEGARHEIKSIQLIDVTGASTTFANMYRYF